MEGEEGGQGQAGVGARRGGRDSRGWVHGMEGEGGTALASAGRPSASPHAQAERRPGPRDVSQRGGAKSLMQACRPPAWRAQPPFENAVHCSRSSSPYPPTGTTTSRPHTPPPPPKKKNLNGSAQLASSRDGFQGGGEVGVHLGLRREVDEGGRVGRHRSGSRRAGDGRRGAGGRVAGGGNDTRDGGAWRKQHCSL